MLLRATCHLAMSWFKDHTKRRNAMSKMNKRGREEEEGGKRERRRGREGERGGGREGGRKG